MKKTLFEQIMTNYKQIANECDEFIKMFNGNFDLEDLTIREFKVLIEKARSLQSKTDSILHNELYHIIGMGNLTPVQTSQFCAVIKKISNARSYFKPVSGYALNKLPSVPDKSDYKCNVAGIKLESIFTNK